MLGPSRMPVATTDGTAHRKIDDQISPAEWITAQIEEFLFGTLPKNQVPSLKEEEIFGERIYRLHGLIVAKVTVRNPDVCQYTIYHYNQ